MPKLPAGFVGVLDSEYLPEWAIETLVRRLLPKVAKEPLPQFIKPAQAGPGDSRHLSLRLIAEKKAAPGSAAVE